MAARKLCLFCDNPVDSTQKEDVIPVWIQKKMKGNKKPVVNGFSGDRRVAMQGLKPTVKTGCVCRVCNHGWMSQLEGDSRKILGPLIEDLSLMLDNSDKHIIAKWAVKTAMALSALGIGKSEPFYTRHECAQFRKSFLFPKFTQVWLGRYSGDAVGGLFNIHGWDRNPKHPEVTHFYVTTLFLRNVAIQVFSVHIGKNKTARRFSSDWYDGPWDQSTIHLVPDGNSFWPPPLSFSDAGNLRYDRLVYRFNVNARFFNPFDPTD
jgi:hypothetical protein